MERINPIRNTSDYDAADNPRPSRHPRSPRFRARIHFVSLIMKGNPPGERKTRVNVQRARFMLAKYLRSGKPPPARCLHPIKTAQLAHSDYSYIRRAQSFRTGIIDADARTLHFDFAGYARASYCRSRRATPERSVANARQPHQ